MFPSLALSTIAMISTILDARITFSVLAIATLLYAIRKDVNLKLRDVSDDESYFNAMMLASILAAFSCFALPKDVVFASIFMLIVHEVRKGVIWNIIAYTSAALIYFTTYDTITHANFQPTYIFFLALAGGLTASLVESVDSNADKRVTIMLATSTVFTIFKLYMPATSLYDLSVAFLISFLMSLAALKTGVADESGLLSATIIGMTTIIFTDLRYFVVLLSFYIIGSAVTKYRYDVKVRLGIAEQAGGARGYSNVFGNSLAALFFAMQYGVSGNDVFAAAFVASLATALGDTMASEIGKVSKDVYLITSLKKVKPGVSGGVSIIGEISAFAGAAIVAVIAVLLGIISPAYAIAVTIAAFIAIHIDSILGATLEQKGYLTNSSVNLLATLSGGVMCYLLFL